MMTGFHRRETASRTVSLLRMSAGLAGGSRWSSAPRPFLRVVCSLIRHAALPAHSSPDCFWPAVDSATSPGTRQSRPSHAIGSRSPLRGQAGPLSTQPGQYPGALLLRCCHRLPRLAESRSCGSVCLCSPSRPPSRHGALLSAAMLPVASSRLGKGLKSRVDSRSRADAAGPRADPAASCSQSRSIAIPFRSSSRRAFHYIVKRARSGSCASPNRACRRPVVRRQLQLHCVCSLIASPLRTVRP